MCRAESGAFINTFYWLIDFTLDSWMRILFFGLSFSAITVYLTLSISFSVHLLLFLSFSLSLFFLSLFGWPGTLYIVQTGLELTEILLLTSKCLDERHAAPCLLS